MKLSKLGIVAVIVVVAILVVAYLAIIGYTTPVPDFKQQGGNNGFQGSGSNGGASTGGSNSGMGAGGNDTVPGSHLAYAVLTIDYTIFPYTGPWTLTDNGNAAVNSPLSVNFVSVKASVQPFVSMSQGQVYEHKTLQFWSGGGGEGGGVTLVTNYYILVTITGPGGYSSVWELSTRNWEQISGSMDIGHFEIQTGRAFFDSDGQYQANVQFFQYVGWSPSPTLVVGALQNFGVNV